MTALQFINQHSDKFWKYIGQRTGQGEMQKVIYTDEHEVVSIGLTHSFLGTPERFVKDFRLIQ